MQTVSQHFCRLFIDLWNSLSDSLRDPTLESERSRQDFKTHLFSGHWRHERIKEVSPFHEIALYKSPITSHLIFAARS